MEIQINEEHNEALETFERYFSDDYGCFKVSLVVDDEIKDTHGRRFQNVCIKIKDTDIESEWIILLDEQGNYHYNVYEDVMEELHSPEEMFKFMYFDTQTKLSRIKE